VLYVDEGIEKKCFVAIVVEMFYTRVGYRDLFENGKRNLRQGLQVNGVHHLNPALLRSFNERKEPNSKSVHREVRSIQVNHDCLSIHF